MTTVLWTAALFLGSLLAFALVAGGIYIMGHVRGVLGDGDHRRETVRRRIGE